MADSLFGRIASDRRIAIVGMGVTGLSCARHLSASGTVFSVLDTRAAPPLLDHFCREFPGVEMICGAQADDRLSVFDELILSPGLSLEHPLLRRAQSLGMPMRSDIDWFVDQARAPVAAITGTNAKSTVTTRLAEAARYCGRRVEAGGNLGKPALDLLGADAELYVLELSSFQLERSGALNPEVAVVLNLAPDHLDRYDDLLAYHRAKHRIFAGARQIVVNRDDALTAPPERSGQLRWSFGLSEPLAREDFGLLERDGRLFLAHWLRPLIAVDELPQQMSHELENYLAVLALARALDLPEAGVVDYLRHASSLPHRCQLLASIDGVDCYDDSKATNAAAATRAVLGIGALQARRGGKLLWLGGGLAKEQDFSALAAALRQHARAITLFGRDAGLLAEALAGVAPIQRVATLEEAVGSALSVAREQDALLLSPACASFDLFENYEARGRAFAADIRSRIEQGGSL